MQTQLIETTLDHKPIFLNLAHLYVHDMSEHVGWDCDAEGWFGCENAGDDRYWTEDHRYAYLIHVKDHLAGFAMVDQLGSTACRDWNVAEFFVVRKYRRRGVGEAAARQLFDRHQGRWDVMQIPKNTPATAFWRKVIGRYSGDRYHEETKHVEHHGRTVVQSFSTEDRVA